MRKIDEIERQSSCWNKAAAEERVFILLERDVATPDTIRFWCSERVRKGKNTWSDDQIKEALQLAAAIAAELKAKADQVKDKETETAKENAVDQNEQVNVAQVNNQEAGAVVDAEMPGEPIPDDPSGKELLDAIPPAGGANPVTEVTDGTVKQIDSANDSAGADGLVADLDAGKKSDANTDDALGYDAGGRLDS